MSESWAFDLVSVFDGDTVRAHLSRNVTLVEGWAMTLHDVQEPGEPEGVPLRLVIVDTPERGKDRWREARQDVIDWLTARRGNLRVVTYKSAGWDRLLADIHAKDDRNDTLSQHLLLLGWLPYGVQVR